MEKPGSILRRGNRVRRAACFWRGGARAADSHLRGGEFAPTGSTAGCALSRQAKADAVGGSSRPRRKYLTLRSDRCYDFAIGPKVLGKRAKREAGGIPARSRHCDQRARRRSRPLLLQAMGRQPVERPSCQSGDLPWDRRGTLRTRAAGSKIHTSFPHHPSRHFSSIRVSVAALPANEGLRPTFGFSGE